MTQLVDYDKDYNGKQTCWESFNLDGDDELPRGLPLWDDHIFQRLDIFDMQPIEVVSDFEFPNSHDENQQGHVVVTENEQDLQILEDDLIANSIISGISEGGGDNISPHSDMIDLACCSSVENVSKERTYKSRARRARANSKKSWACPTCGIGLVRDFARHMRTHDEVARFQCPFARDKCPHRTGQFNRQYDMKKHLLHDHFRLDRPSARRSTSLNEKLKETGKCHCGISMSADEFLDSHILSTQQTQSICCLLGNNARPWKVKPGRHRVSTRTLKWT